MEWGWGERLGNEERHDGLDVAGGGGREEKMERGLFRSQK